MQAVCPVSASLKDAAALSPKAKRSQGHTATTRDIHRALHLTTDLLTLTLARELPTSLQTTRVEWHKALPACIQEHLRISPH